MECELLLLQPTLLPALQARFEPRKENAAFRANRDPHEPPLSRGLREMLRLPRLAHN